LVADSLPGRFVEKWIQIEEVVERTQRRKVPVR
jgi:hypothetical protein